SAVDLGVAGVTMPGVPGVILGRNRRVAWGATNVHDDCADLYVEQFDPAHPDRYRVGDGWETVTVRDEPIRVRTGLLSSSWRTVDHRVRTTRHGPLVPVRGRLYALRWTSLDDTPDLPAFFLIDRAGDWDEFREGLRLFAGPSQNFVYADADGHLPCYSAGPAPLRLARALREAAARHKGDPAWDDVTREMSGWDGRLEPGSRPGALAMTAFLALGDRVIGPRVEGLPEAETLRHRSAAIDRLIRERPAGWLPAGSADWDAVLLDAWQEACARLEP